MRTLSPTPPELSDLLAGAMAGRHTVVLPAAKDGRVHVVAPSSFVAHSSRPGDGPPALVVYTSGSTGAPKGVALSAEALQASGRATERWLGGPGTWYLPLAPHHIAGAQVLLRSLMAGTDPLVSLGHFSADRFATDTTRLAARGEAEADGGASEGPAASPSRLYASLVPTQLVRILRDSAATRAAARFDAILLGGASVAPSVMNQADAAGLNIVRTYGMSETGGGCVYNGVPFDEVQMSINEAGRVVLSGAVLADGYVEFHEDTGALYALSDGDSGFGYVDGTRCFTTSDLGQITDGVLAILGRADDVIVVGAENVAPLAVENALLKVLEPLGVSEVLITSVPDPEWGNTLVALVHADDGEFAVSRPESTEGKSTRPGPRGLEGNVGAGAAAASPATVTEAADQAERVRQLLPGDGSFPGIWRPRFVLPVATVPAKGIGKPDRRAARDLAEAVLSAR